MGWQETRRKQRGFMQGTHFGQDLACYVCRIGHCGDPALKDESGQGCESGSREDCCSSRRQVFGVDSGDGSDAQHERDRDHSRACSGWMQEKEKGCRRKVSPTQCAAAAKIAREG